MTAVKYTYSKVVAPDKLEFDIRSSQILVSLDRIECTSISVDVWFKSTLDSNSESILTAIINTHIPVPLLYQGSVRDPDNAIITRPKAAKAGWAYQLCPINFHTSTLDSVSCNKLNPVSRLEEPTGYTTINNYDVNNTRLTEPNQMVNCVWTIIDWCVNHEIEVIGGTYYQNEVPTVAVTDPNTQVVTYTPVSVFMWLHLAPGILNFPFINGGINLKMLGPGGQVRADGRVSKYLHPTQPMPGLNRCRITFKHPPGLVHEGQFMFEYFKPVT